MVIFVIPYGKSIDKSGVILEVTGRKYGYLYGETVEAVCNKLLKHIDKVDTVYVDIESFGILVADMLSEHTNVVRFRYTKNDYIGDEYQLLCRGS